jgi:hypothetical protein
VWTKRRALMALMASGATINSDNGGNATSRQLAIVGSAAQRKINWASRGPPPSPASLELQQVVRPSSVTTTVPDTFIGPGPPRVVHAAHASIAADGQPLLADHGHEISQPLTASVRCSRKSTPMDRLTTNRRDKASLSGPRCTRFQYQTGPSIPAHRRKCGLADCWESSACKFR